MNINREAQKLAVTMGLTSIINKINYTIESQNFDSPAELKELEQGKAYLVKAIEIINSSRRREVKHKNVKKTIPNP